MVIAPSAPLPSVTASIAALSPSVLTLPAVISIAPPPTLRPLRARMPREPVPVVVTDQCFGGAADGVDGHLPLAPAAVVTT